MDRDSIRKALRPRDNFPSIIGQDGMFRSAVLIPLVREKGQWSLLFQKRAAGIRQAGEICFPGGRFDEDQDRDFLDTAVRETCEEIGVSPAQIEILGSQGTLVTPMNVVVQPYTGILKIKSTEELKPNEDEVEELFTIPLQWFKDNGPSLYELPVRVHPYSENNKTGEIEFHFPSHELDLPERYKSPWEGSIPHKIWTWKTSKGTLWGITAEILADILPALLD
ncbi:MAG: CoA pyrophosphatase [Spirochaetales bacterium]|nr:CoA pyrophosphatase [Spirochaetales bacterium]